MKYITLILGIFALLIIGCSKKPEHVTGLLSGRTIVVTLSDVSMFVKSSDADKDGNFDILLLSSDRKALAIVISQEEKEKVYTYIGKDAAEELKMGNEDGKAKPAAGGNEEDKAKDNIPIGKYTAEGEGWKLGDLVVNKLNLRDDAKVEINDELNGGWYRDGRTEGHYIISFKIGLKAGSGGSLSVNVDDKYLAITGWSGYLSPKKTFLLSQANEVTSKFNPAKKLTEKDFIRYKRVD
jgi:hypothetical protein